MSNFEKKVMFRKHPLSVIGTLLPGSIFLNLNLLSVFSCFDNLENVTCVAIDLEIVLQNSVKVSVHVSVYLCLRPEKHKQINLLC